MFKKAQVMLLPTEKANGSLLKGFKTLQLFPDRYFTQEYLQTTGRTSEHLYIINDDKIEECDWILHKNSIYKVRINKGLYLTLESLEHIDVRTDLCKKIIATTDKNLIDGVRWNKEFPLPQLSQQFIEKYIEEYNKGFKIKFINVEYEVPYDSDQLDSNNGDWDKYYSIYEESLSYKNQQYEDILEWSFNEGKKHLQLFSKLKVDKNNNITIRKIQDSFSREEVIELLTKIVKEEPGVSGVIEYWNWHNKWIEENL